MLEEVLGCGDVVACDTAVVAGCLAGVGGQSCYGLSKAPADPQGSTKTHLINLFCLL